jgi:DNA helicase-2/ATP-dependent DNA helicase PcrA
MSRFIEQLPRDHVTFEDQMYRPAYESNPRSSYGNRLSASSYDNRGGEVTVLPAAQANSNKKWNYGDRVSHSKFGQGTVTTVQGETLTIRFDQAGLKSIMAAYVTKLCEGVMWGRVLEAAPPPRN